MPTPGNDLNTFDSKSLNGNTLQLNMQSGISSSSNYGDNDVSDDIGFYYWPLVGDGSMSFQLASNPVFSVYDTNGSGEMISIMIRNELNARKSNSIGFVIYTKTGSNLAENIKIVKRTGPTSYSFGSATIPYFYRHLFGYFKLQKVGNQFSFYVSDDEKDWFQVNSTVVSDSVSGNYWGIAVESGWSSSQTTHTFKISNIKFYGFSASTGCSSSEFYAYQETSGGCQPIASSPKNCGDNIWKMKLINSGKADFGTNGDYPSISATATTVSISGSLRDSSIDNTRSDGFIFGYKAVSGDGSISAKTDTRTGNAIHYFGGTGVVIRQSLDTQIQNSHGDGVLMSACMIPRDQRAYHYYRKTKGTNSVKAYSQLNVPFGSHIKITKSGSTITCYYSTDSGNNWNYVDQQTITFTGTFYVGVGYVGTRNIDGKPQPQTVTLSDINFIGFNGYCNNNGDCKTIGGNLDKCYCATGYSGTYCENYLCYGTLNNDASVCNNQNGTCSAPNTCVCNENYAGNECQYPKCFGILSNEPTVCSAHGSCISPDSCRCATGHTGTQCETPICFEHPADNEKVCSGHGSCTTPDICSCGTGYTGTQCENAICGGLSGSNACNAGNGTCISPNVCNCSTNYAGDQCEYPKCNDIASSDSKVCNYQNGTCISPNVCDCKEGYQGDFCETPICYSKVNPIACSSGNGTCVAGNKCECLTGLAGDECEKSICFGILSSFHGVCSNKGRCIAPNTCICDDGYTGNKCEIPICFGETDPTACSGNNGTCITSDTCNCTSGFSGNQCEIPICFGKLSNDSTICSGNGNCIAPDTCICSSSYDGNNCENPICYGVSSTQELVCSGNGTCSKPNQCICSNSYFGDKCDIFTCNEKLSNDSSVCHSNGSCIGKEQCYCNDGYIGLDCEFNICNEISSNLSSVCSSNGICSSPNTCNCFDGWTGNDCETFICLDRNNCSSHGTCIGPNSCNCNSEYTGSNCSLPICFGIASNFPQVCSGNGRCNSPDTCECLSSGYSGIYCNVTVCTDVDNCNANGLCVGANNCSCFSGWHNSNCSVFDCDAVKNCSYPKGICTGPDNCNCTSQWSGNDCNSPVCYSVSSLKSNVCSGNGNCSDPDICKCKQGWTGNNCEHAICNSIVSTNSSVCNSRGSCSIPNNCTCNSGFTGNDCQYTICNGISNEFISVCSNHGTCNSPNICNCQYEYTGFDCEIPICFGKPGNNSNSCTSIKRGTCSSPNNCSCNIGYSGNECQNNICFGIDSTNSDVCSTNGNCTEKDICTCQTSYYGKNCEFSDLYNFVNSSCSIGCKVNKTSFKECTDFGPECYCNKNVQNIKTICDSSFRIIELSLRNLGFTGSIPNMLNFTSLQKVDLSLNSMKSSSKFEIYLPNSIRLLNLSYNSISNAGDQYEVQKSYFTKFESLIMDGNEECGIYPETWLENTFTISTVNHQKSLYCESFDSNSCSFVSLKLSNYVMLPHEIDLKLNYTIESICKYYLGKSKIRCLSTKFDKSNTIDFITKSKSTNDNNIICSRSGLLNDIDQYLSIGYKYNSSLTERITTNIHLINLPYSNISSIDRHLIHSDNTGKSQIVQIKTDQNMTRYRKNIGNNVKCAIIIDGYFVLSESISMDGKLISCVLNLTVPNTGEKQIILYEYSENHRVSLNHVSFWLITTKLTTPEIYSSFIGDISLTDTNGALLPGKSGFNYKLNNTRYSIDFPCLFSSGKIQNCKKSSTISFPGDILLIPLSFHDGNVVISTIETIFYQKNKIVSIYPKAIISNVITDVYVEFNSSTLNSSMLNINYYCVHQNGNYSAIVMNSTMIKCLSVSYSKSHTFTFNVHAIYKSFNMILNENPFEFYTIKKSSIYPSSSITSISGTRNFEFSFTENIDESLASSLECQLEDLTIIPATRINSNEFKCIITSTIHRNLTFWFKDSKGFRSELSLNFISLFFFNFGSISYDSTSKQFGNTLVSYDAIVKLDSANIPLNYRDRVVFSVSNYGCSILTSTAGFKNIGMSFKEYGAFKVQNIHNTFKNFKNLTFVSTNALDTSLYLKYTKVDTGSLILSKNMKSDCSDVVVTYKGKEISRNVKNCGTSSSTIVFKVQESVSGSISGYDIYFGNPDVNRSNIITGVEYSFVPSITTTTESILTLNNNQLIFGFFKLFSISKIDPVGALISNSTIQLWNNYVNVNYSGKVRFEVHYDSSTYDATFINPIFKSNIFSLTGKKINITIWAVYIPTGESVIGTSNHIEFIFMDLIQTNYLYPFIDKFSISSNNKNSSVQITSSSDLFTDVGLNCAYNHNGKISYSRAKFVNGNTKLVSCFMEVNNLLSTSELIGFNLFMNVSDQNSNLNFILTSNNLTYVYLKEPIQILIPNTITPHYFNTNFTLNFTNPLKLQHTKVSFDDYKMKLIPEYSTKNPSKLVKCDFSSPISICSIDGISLTHTPMRIDYEIQVSSSHFSEIVNFTMTSNLFKENVTFLSELPYVGDSISQQNSKLTVEFNISKKLHPSYSYYCRIYSNDIPSVNSESNENIFSCSFNTLGIEEVVPISLFINSTEDGLGGIISTTSSMIQIVSLKFIPEFTTFEESKTLILSKNNSNSFIVPSNYHDLKHKIISNLGNEFPCSINGTGIISCSKINIIEQSTLDIYSLGFKVQYEKVSSIFSDLLNVHQGLILYKNREIMDLFPHASKIGNNINLTLTFIQESMRNEFKENIDFYCEYNKNNSLGVKLTDKSIKCPIIYNDHQSNIIQLKSFFRIPNLSGNKNIYITLNESITKLYYLTPSSISFSYESQVQFSLTETQVEYFVNITTFIPSHLTEYFALKLSDSSGFATINNFTTSFGNTFQFRALTKTNFGGKKQLSLWYKENDFSFQISSNTLELIFAKTALITGISPLAAIVNRTNTLTIATGFDTSLDYGNSNFTCKYGYIGNVYENVVQATKLSDGKFECDVSSFIEGKPLLSIWMTSKGIERKLTLIDETFNFISSDYFQPAFGLPIGNEKVIIAEYNHIESNVTFIDSNLDSKYQFDCFKNISSLYCSTPELPSTIAPSFNSYALKFSESSLKGKNLSVHWIVYEKREIVDFYPQVVSGKDLTFPLNITLDKNVTMIQGELIGVFAPLLSYRTDISFGTLNNEITVQNDITPLSVLDPKGTFEIQLFYKNIHSIEFRSMFPISTAKNITILSTSIIEFVSGTNNIGYTNQITNFTIKLNDGSLLLDEQKSKVQCKIGNSFVKTYFDPIIPKQYICSSSASIETATVATLWYRDSYAYKGEIQVSSNSLDIMFINNINITSVTPFASISKSQKVQLNSSLTSDFYGSRVEYKCVFSGVVTDAVLKGSVFECLIGTVKSIDFSNFTSINIVSKTTKISIPFSTNQDSNSQFYFLNQISTISIFPFSQGHKFNGISSLSDEITLNIENDLLISRGLFCRYESMNDGVLYSKALNNGNSKRSFNCHIEKKTFSNVVEMLKVSLFMDTNGNHNFSVTSDFQAYLFIREPISWNIKRLVNENTLKNPSAMLFTLPSLGMFNYQLNMTPVVDFPITSKINCDYSGNTPLCAFSQSNIETITALPSQLNLTFYISHSKSGEISKGFEVDYLTYYYSQMTFEHLKPYLISYYERLYKPVKIIANVAQILNYNRFKFKCNFTFTENDTRSSDVSFDLLDSEYQPGINTSHLSCLFKTFGTPSSVESYQYELKLIFASEYGDVVISPNAAKITSLLEIPEMKPNRGLSSGKFPVVLDFSYGYPTDYKLYNYSLSIDFGPSKIQMEDCTFPDSEEENPQSVTCTFPNLHKNISNWNTPKKFPMIFSIDGIYGFKLNPYFTVYSLITMKELKPSMYVKKDSKTQVYIHTSQPILFSGESFGFQIAGVSQIASDACSVENSFLLLCNVPELNAVGNYDMRVSIDFKHYQSLGRDLIVFDDTLILVDAISSTQLSYIQPTDIYVIGSNFFNSSDILVSIYDDYVKRESSGVFINSTHIKTTISPWYDLKMELPRDLSVKLSFNGGSNYINSKITVTLSKYHLFSVSPSIIALGMNSVGIKILGFPKSNLYKPSNASFDCRLYHNSSYYLNVDCSNFDSCWLKTAPQFEGKYTMKIGLFDNDKNWNEMYFSSSNDITVYNFDTTSSILWVKPNRTIIQNNTQLISVNGDFKNFKSVQFKISIFDTLFSTIASMNVPGSINENEVSLNLPSTSRGISLDISMSFNDGVNYHPVLKYDKLIDPYSIVSVKPIDTDVKNLLNFLSSRDLNSEIIGKQFDTTIDKADIKLILKNSEGTYDITSISEFNVESSTRITFISPKIERLNITYEVRYPLELQLGLSFNSGNDFIFTSYVYENSFPQPVFTGISPLFTVRHDLNVTIYGLTLELGKNCSVYLDKSNAILGNELYEIAPILIQETNSTIKMYCPIPKELMENRTSIYLTLKNAQNEINVKGYDIEFYTAPFLEQTVPKIGASYGGYQITFLGTGIVDIRTSAPYIYCKFGNILCEKVCERQSSTSVVCTAPPHPANIVTVSLSYNKIDWHEVNETSFQYTTCDAGYTASTYKEACNLCPPGTYKPTGGLYECIQCEIGTSSTFAGSLSCESCPTNTTGFKKSSTTHEDCLCDKGFYLNLELEQHAGAFRKCIPCPTGAVCTYNTTEPIALPGYWNSKDNFHNFYACVPKESCPGGKPENCTIGYSGIRCGQCRDNYYKFRGKCGACGDPFLTDSDTPEENFTSMNDIFFDLLSIERMKRKLFLVQRKGTKVTSKIAKKFKKKTEEEKELDSYLKQLKGDTEFQKTLKKYKSENKKMSKAEEKELAKMEMQRIESQLKGENENSTGDFRYPNSPQLLKKGNQFSSLLSSSKISKKDSKIDPNDFSGSVIIKKHK
eukprot:gene8549-372_t